MDVSAEEESESSDDETQQRIGMIWLLTIISHYMYEDFIFNA